MKSIAAWLGVALSLGVCWSACRREPAKQQTPSSPAGPRDTGALDGARNEGLNAAEASRFFHQTIGSDSLPLFVLSQMKQPDGRPFLENLERFGLLTDPSYDENLERLPIGMTVHLPPDLPPFNVRFYGFTCAACHVGELSAGKVTARVVGAPGRFDLARFHREFAGSASTLTSALAPLRTVMLEYYDEVTRASEDMTDPIGPGLKRVLSEAALTAGAAAGEHPFLASLRRDLEAVRTKVVRLKPEDLARQDPLLGRAADPADRTIAVISPATLRLATHRTRAPAFLTEVPVAERRDVLNGFLGDFLDVLRLVRARIAFAQAAAGAGKNSPGPGRVDVAPVTLLVANGGKMPPKIAAFAPVGIPPLWQSEPLDRLPWDAFFEHGILQAVALGAPFHPRTHRSSLQARNLTQVLQNVPRLRAPRWPFHPPDAPLVEAGRAVYAGHCARCHEPGQDGLAVDPKVGTDPSRRELYRLALGGESVQDRLAQVLGAVKGQAFAAENVPEEERRKIAGGGTPARGSAADGYAARGLAGIWATAPYLHNDSVPTLADLLNLDVESERPHRRPARFSLAQGRYDVRRVGIEVRPQPDLSPFDATQPGNDNGGHDYGTALARSEKIALLEFLKAL